MSIRPLIFEINSPTQLSGAMFLGVITFEIGWLIQEQELKSAEIHRKINVSSSLSNFKLLDSAHIIRICSGHEFHRF